MTAGADSATLARLHVPRQGRSVPGRGRDGVSVRCPRRGRPPGGRLGARASLRARTAGDDVQLRWIARTAARPGAAIMARDRPRRASARPDDIGAPRRDAIAASKGPEEPTNTSFLHELRDLLPVVGHLSTSHCPTMHAG